MPIRVRLKEIVEGMELQNDEITAYLHRPTGRVVMVGFEDAWAVDFGDGEMMDGEQLAEARKIAAGSDEYLALPDRFEINEYRMMERFSLRIDDERTKDLVLVSLHGSGAFRRFKDAMHLLGLADSWYSYRNDAYAEVARDWCEVNGIEHDSPRAES
jgi:hypothetical protein